jgi:amidophosphoribosyltransferase
VREFPDHDIDVVIPIPDTSRTAALQVAYHLGVKYREGFIKNRYIGRTFIMPGQAERAETTSKQIIKLAREAGARKVYFASAAPPVRYPNVYGIDMPAASELIANGRDVEEIEKLIGADRLMYQDLHGLIRSVRHDNSDTTEFDTSCFSGEYVAGEVTDEYLTRLELRRNDAAKERRKSKRKGLITSENSNSRKPKPAVGM